MSEDEAAAGVTAEAGRVSEPGADWQQEQAGRYLKATYGPDVIYRAPETFENLVEQWIWSVASGAAEFGEACMAAIEAHRAGRRD